jgi:hypothetical protein
LIIDACYSGLAMQRTAQPTGKRFLSDMLQRYSRQVVTAGKADETVADGGGPQGENSIFTVYLLKGLSGEATSEDGILTSSRLMQFVYEKVGRDSRSKQTPAYGHIDGDGDFILITPQGQHIGLHPLTDVLLEVEQEKPEVVTAATEPTDLKPSVALRWNYGDPDHPSYGRNDLSKLLGEHRYLNGQHSIVTAFSWLAIILEPTAKQSVAFDIGKKALDIHSLYQQGQDPFRQFQVPMSVKTTLNSLVLFDEWSTSHDSRLWSRFLRITKEGCLEYCESKNSFAEANGRRVFWYVQVIGLFWQLLWFYKELLRDVQYFSGVHCTFSLVGTRDSILADFATEPGEKKQSWREPLREAALMSNDSSMKCNEPNIKLDYDFVAGQLNETESFKLIKDVAQNLGLAYNHQSEPRCFNCRTDIFPWKQFISNRRF